MAYRCFATAEELEEMRRTQKERGAKQPYDRRYRDLPEAEIERLLASGRPHVIRLKMPLDGETVIHDGLRGEIRFGNDELDDAVEAGADAILLVNAPDGLFYYSDDYRGTSPAITFYNPAEGLYDIWIGSYDGSRRNPARLIFTEYDY